MGAVVQTDGKLLVAGVTWNDSMPGTRRAVLGRYGESGELDSTFAETGALALDFPGLVTTFNDLVIHNDQRVVAVGQQECQGILVVRSWR